MTTTRALELEGKWIEWGRFGLKKEGRKREHEPTRWEPVVLCSVPVRSPIASLFLETSPSVPKRRVWESNVRLW